MLDGADQRAPGDHPVAFGDAFFHHHFQLRHGVTDLPDHVEKLGTDQRPADKGALVEKILAVQMLGERQVPAVPGQVDVLTDEFLAVIQ